MVGAQRLKRIRHLVLIALAFGAVVFAVQAARRGAQTPSSSRLGIDSVA